MKKIKLRNSTSIGNSLSREELKQVYGGDGSNGDCKSDGDTCHYVDIHGVKRTGTCKLGFPFSYGYICWGG